ncbi:MAG: sugar phosphate nucleotidyltransferase [Bacteroidota bacterium]|nr:nucleotidyltransferase family protein [Ignavibacteria bacterium]MCU7498815.1 nucleotidyltransferase family protein [Ignavibacteria bacterium]MCU7512182.1 nucleotidyltransferase family protein [Ignavibacteria bacterium]MCU7520531.1 nucleotidyltransferase family protein [Ignavibacteria bacterium]MCU7524007.1 nucleotidyltransferase family protein [Ignavibacteria bacterium]
MWGIIPAAGSGSRIQPLAFSKELLPVGSRMDGQMERPKAVSEYLLERMITAGAKKICFVISPGKSDIMEYYGQGTSSINFCYTVQQHPRGLCDAIFSALPFIGKNENVLIGLPDTIWFPEDGLCDLPGDKLSFLLFPVVHPEFFDAVVTDTGDNVLKIEVKQKDAHSNWIWGAFRMPGNVLHELHDLWLQREKKDEYMGTLVNAYIDLGGEAKGIRKGQSYVDVGTLNGYREAINLLYSKQKVVME